MVRMASWDIVPGGMRVCVFLAHGKAHQIYVTVEQENCRSSRTWDGALVWSPQKTGGITRTGVNPSLLRETFAARYPQKGGNLITLRDLLGHEESARVKRALQMDRR